MAQSKQDELYKALQQKGYPDSLCREIAYKQMNTDYTATRMLGYLYRISDPVSYTHLTLPTTPYV